LPPSKQLDYKNEVVSSFAYKKIYFSYYYVLLFIMLSFPRRRESNRSG
jgi:hypothetical protein